MALITAVEIVNQGLLKAVPINSRFDASLISPHIQTAELRHLKSFICDAFYNDLVAEKDGIGQYNADLGTVTAAYTTNTVYEALYKNYLLPYMANAIVLQSLPFIGLQIGSNGVFAAGAEFGQNTGAEGIKFLQKQLLETVNILKDNILKHLCENQTLYPLFCSTDFCIDTDCDGQTDEYKGTGNDLGIVFY